MFLLQRVQKKRGHNILYTTLTASNTFVFFDKQHCMEMLENY